MHDLLVASYYRSFGQFLAGVSFIMSSNNPRADMMARCTVPYVRRVLGKEISVSPARHEIVDKVFSLCAFEDASGKGWDGDELLLILDGTPRPMNPEIANLISSWPPDPDNDLCLRSYLRTLGWKLCVETSGKNSFTIRLNFGKSLQ